MFLNHFRTIAEQRGDIFEGNTMSQHRKRITKPMRKTVFDLSQLEYAFKRPLPVPYGRFWLRVSRPEEMPPRLLDIAEVLNPIFWQWTAHRRPSFRRIKKNRPVLKPCAFKARRVLYAKPRMPKQK